MEQYIKVIDYLDEIANSEFQASKGRHLQDRTDKEEYIHMRELMRECGGFEIFDNMFQRLENVRELIHLDYLTDWLVNRCKEVTPSETVKNAIDFTHAEQFKTYYCVWFLGLMVKEPYQLTDNISLVPVYNNSIFSVDWKEKFIPDRKPT